MKKNMLKKISFMLIFVFSFTFAMTGCGKSEGGAQNAATPSLQRNGDIRNESGEQTNAGSKTDGNSGSSAARKTTELAVSFGDAGKTFTLHLYDNDTAAAIARHVGTADWRLPIYHYNDYDNWEVMQYYDIPSRYSIPSDAKTITSEKAGEVYYSAPNRIVLFYGDAQVTGEYTQVGYFDYTEEFKSAVENNPVLPGWGNKIVLISTED